MKKGIWIVVAVLVILAIIGFARGGDENKQAKIDGPVKLGFIGPLTGDAAALGENALAAAKLAVAEINAAGGINGQPVELIAEDGQCTGNVSSNAANKLINSDKVVGIVGGLCSAETSSFTAIAEQAMVPIVSYCSSAPALSEAGDYMFRVYPSDSFQGVYAADFVKQELGKSKVAVLYTNDDWGVGIQATFIEQFKKLGGEVVAVESFEKSARDLRTQISKIKAANPEAIYMPGFTEASIPGIKQLKELGLNVPVVGGDAWGDPTIWEQTKAESEGFMYTEVSVPDNAELAANLEKDGHGVTVCTPHAYDVVKIYADVISKVGVGGEAIKNELYKVSYTEGLSAPSIQFDENGDLKGAVYRVKVVKNGVAEDLK